MESWGLRKKRELKKIRSGKNYTLLHSLCVKKIGERYLYLTKTAKLEIEISPYSCLGQWRIL